jgi:Ca-activated chloride channel family protein
MKSWLRILRDVRVLLALAAVGMVMVGCARPVEQYQALKLSMSARNAYLQAAPGARALDQVPSQSLPPRDEELWVIEKSASASPQAADDAATPGSGALVTKSPRDGKNVPVPLKHTDVKASVAGYIATVDVTQQFHNPYDGKIEAVYVFPLPHNAAVNEFVMTVGDRRIRGIVRERQEAQKIYQQARAQGYVASLLTQERPNVFTQAVANIEPGKQIDINIKYFNTLSYSDGWYEFVFPMVVGPRFNPPGTTGGIGAVTREGGGDSKHRTNVPYLRPGERSGHDISLAVQLDAGVPVEAIESRTHRVAVTQHSPQRAQVALDEADRIPNRDFVLRWKVAGDKVKSGLLVQRDDRGGKGGGYFSLMLIPPDDLKKLPRSPLEMVFTLDVSGSMLGQPIDQAKSAVRWALTHMRADDTFQIVKFAGNAETFAPRPVPATPENVRQALGYIEGTSAGGGTMMLEGIKRSLEFPADESRPRCVAFLTDGYIGNEAEILGALHQVLGPSRVFSFGVGSSVNRYLLEHMAKLGNGAVAYIGLKEPGSEAMAAYFERISHPALTGISLDFNGAHVEEVLPQRVPDLFVGRPVIVTGRFTGTAPTGVKIKGIVRGEEQRMEVAAAPEESEGAGAGKALPLVWARMKIADLADRSAYEPTGDLEQQIRQVALDYGLMSSYTAFIAVDSLTRTQGDHGTTVSVPVPVPAGVRYETTVTESGADEKERG